MHYLWLFKEYKQKYHISHLLKNSTFALIFSNLVWWQEHNLIVIQTASLLYILRLSAGLKQSFSNYNRKWFSAIMCHDTACISPTKLCESLKIRIQIIKFSLPKSKQNDTNSVNEITVTYNIHDSAEYIQTSFSQIKNQWAALDNPAGIIIIMIIEGFNKA